MQILTQLLPKIVTINILTKYLYLSEYAKFEIANTNTSNKNYIKKLTKLCTFNPTFLDNTIICNKYFLNWVLLRDIYLNELLICKNKINTKYLTKIASKLKSIQLENTHKNLENITFVNLDNLVIVDNKLNDYKLFNITNCKNITNITFEENELQKDSKTIKNLNNFLVEDTELLKTITIIMNIPKTFRNRLIKSADNMLIRILQKCKNLTSLNLHDCVFVSDNSMLELTKNYKIHELTISDNRYISDNFIIEMSKNENIEHLKILNLSYCTRITNTSLQEIFKKCINIETLELTFTCNLSNKTLDIISDNCPNLIDITINYYFVCTSYELCKLLNNCVNIKNINFNLSITDTSHYIKIITELSKSKILEKVKISNSTSIRCDNEMFLIFKYVRDIKINNPDIKILDVRELDFYIDVLCRNRNPKIKMFEMEDLNHYINVFSKFSK